MEAMESGESGGNMAAAIVLRPWKVDQGPGGRPWRPLEFVVVLEAAMRVSHS